MLLKQILISLSESQTGIGAAAHTTLETELLISYTRTVIIDTITSLHNSEGEVILVTEVHDILTKLHGILGEPVFNIRLVIQLKNKPIILLLLPGNIMRSGLSSSQF